MCGIAGHAGPTPVPPERIERTLGLMRHRGPDHGEHRSFTTPAGHTRRPAAHAPQHHRPRGALGPAVQRRLHVAGLQRRALQLHRGPRRAGAARRRVPHRGRHRGDHDGPRPRRLGRARPLRGHVGVRELRRRERHARPVARPLRREAAVRVPGGRGPLLRLGGEVHRRAARSPAAGEPPPPASLPGQRLQGALQDDGHLLRRAARSSTPAPGSSAGPPARSAAGATGTRDGRRPTASPTRRRWPARASG